MWRLWPTLRIISAFILVGVGASVVAGLFFDKPRKEVIENIVSAQVFPILLVVIVLFGLLCLLSGNSYRRKRLVAEFSLFTLSESIRPEDFGFVRMAIGQPDLPGRRPHYPPHIPRMAVKYDERNLDDGHSQTWSEDDLAKLLIRREGFVLQGEPTCGKSRVLYNVIRKISDVRVVRPLHSRLPSNEALSLCRGSGIILLFDDLNEFTGSGLDLLEMTQELDRRQIGWTVAAACRDGSELGTVQESVGTTLRKFYEQIPHKLALLRPNDDEKRSLILQLKHNKNAQSIRTELYPTLGSIAMSDALQAMKSRFEKELTSDARDCLRAIQLLLHSEVSPISHDRLVIVMTKIFGCRNIKLRDILRRLGELAFLGSDELDPVEAEIAYLTGSENASVVTYFADRSIDDDRSQLVSEFLTARDIKGLLSIGSCLYDKRKFSEAHNVYNQLVQRFSEGYAEGEAQDIAKAMYMKGLSLSHLSRDNDSISAYEEVLRRFDNPTDKRLREIVAKALFNKGRRLGVLGKKDQELAINEEVLLRFGANPTGGIKEPVAKANVNRGIWLDRHGRRDEALEVFDHVLKTFGDSVERFMKIPLAYALLNKGISLSRIDRNTESLAAYDELVRRFGNSPEEDIQEVVASALMYKALKLGRLGKLEDSLAVYEEILHRFGKSTEKQIMGVVAKSMVNRAIVIHAIGRSEEGLELLEEALNALGDAPSGDVRYAIANAHYNKGVVLGLTGRTDDALSAYELVFGKFGNDTQQEIRAVVARSLLNRASILGQMGRSSDELAVYDELLSRFSNSDEDIAEPLAKATLNRGIVLDRQGQFEAAIANFDQVVREFGASTEEAIKKVIALSFFNKATTLEKLGRHQASLEALDELLSKYGKSNEPSLQEIVTMAAAQRRGASMH